MLRPHYPIIASIVISYCVVFSNITKANEVSLSEREMAMIPIAALTAIGDTTKLADSLNAGLDNGLTINEINEIFIHAYAYAGFPRALNGINTFIEVTNQRKKDGIIDVLGKTASPVPLDFNANEYGHAVRNNLVGIDMSNRTTGYAGFVPTIEKFLVEHLFADIFYRDVLSVKDRELLTISMLSALDSTESQLRGHTNLAIRVGFTPSQLMQFTHILKTHVSQQSAIRASKVLNEILNLELQENIQNISVSTDASVTQAPKDNFYGLAEVSSRFTSPIEGHYRGAIVTFKAGARTNWHTHPNGQTLIVISGRGLVQKEGGDMIEMNQGTVVSIPPNVKHWHGAAADSSMSHVAISTPKSNQTVSWLEPAEIMQND
jgi:quercetin dioxygenase-like cupin family protein/alkylhydroperoxidase/carboxymuconolactone decarboxylase family protein YurZ